jgi:hypothetical protein
MSARLVSERIEPPTPCSQNRWLPGCARPSRRRGGPRRCADPRWAQGAKSLARQARRRGATAMASARRRGLGPTPARRGLSDPPDRRTAGRTSRRRPGGVGSRLDHAVGGLDGVAEAASGRRAPGCSERAVRSSAGTAASSRNGRRLAASSPWAPAQRALCAPGAPPRASTSRPLSSASAGQPLSAAICAPFGGVAEEAVGVLDHVRQLAAEAGGGLDHARPRRQSAARGL